MDNRTMNRTEFGARLVGILAGVIAVIVFAINISQDHQERRSARTDIWRKAVIQRILQQTEGNRLGINELLTKMIDSAWSEREVEISKDDITEEKVRVLLLELIEMEIIDQHIGDNYGLRFRTEQITKQDLADEMNKLLDQFLTPPSESQ